MLSVGAGGLKGYHFSFGGLTERVIAIKKETMDTVLAQADKPVPEPGKSYQVEAVRLGPLFEFFVDGKRILSAVDPEPLQPKDGFKRLMLYSWGDGARFSDIKVYLPENQAELDAMLESFAKELGR